MCRYYNQPPVLSSALWLELDWLLGACSRLAGFALSECFFYFIDKSEVT